MSDEVRLLRAQLAEVEALLRAPPAGSSPEELHQLRDELAEAVKLISESSTTAQTSGAVPVADTSRKRPVSDRKEPESSSTSSSASSPFASGSTQLESLAGVSPAKRRRTTAQGENELFHAAVRIEGEIVPEPLAVDKKWENPSGECILPSEVLLRLPPTPTTVQRYAIPILLSGRDLLCSAPTGSGKTLAFVLPIILMVQQKILSADKSPLLSYHCAFPFAAVLCPTRELASQTFDAVSSVVAGLRPVIRVVLLCGGLSQEAQAETLRQTGCDIVIATPGRLLDFIRREKVSLKRSCILVMDEADRMLDMGFEDDVRKILSDFERPLASALLDRSPDPGHVTAVFSATFPRQIRQLAGDLMGPDRVGVVVGHLNSAAATVTHRVFYVDGEKKLDRLRELLADPKTESRSGVKVLVFVATKKTVDFLASQLARAKMRVFGLHGSLPQSSRDWALKSFRAALPGVSVLVATDVAARGIDIPDEIAVVNFDLPRSLGEYVHRTGRTGRAGTRGTATSFFCWQYDRKLAPDLRNFLEAHGQTVPEFLRHSSAEDATEGPLLDFS